MENYENFGPSGLVRIYIDISMYLTNCCPQNVRLLRSFVVYLVYYCDVWFGMVVEVLSRNRTNVSGF